jgi:hypothetical protein
MDSAIGETARQSQLLDSACRHPRQLGVIAARRNGVARLHLWHAPALLARVERNGPRHKRIEVSRTQNSVAVFNGPITLSIIGENFARPPQDYAKGTCNFHGL